MSDKEKLLNLLKDFGVEFREVDGAIECHEGMEKVVGYSCFYVQFTFNDDGSFANLGAYE